MMAKTYAEKLRDPKWQRRRLEVLERSGWQCCECGETSRELHVHHGYYEKGLDPWEYPDDTLHALCKDCHASMGAERVDLERAIGRLSPSECQQVRGYVLAMVANCSGEAIVANDYPTCNGIADYLGATTDSVVQIAQSREDHVLSGEVMQGFGLCSRERTNSKAPS